MKIIGTVWFTNMDGHCIGIVTIENDIGERKAYIGLGEGRDEEVDAQHIAENGAPVYKAFIRGVLDMLNKVDL